MPLTNTSPRIFNTIKPGILPGLTFPLISRKEKRNIRDVELPAADKLQEGQRVDYYSTSSYPTVSPTSTKPNYSMMQDEKRKKTVKKQYDLWIQRQIPKK